MSEIFMAQPSTSWEHLEAFYYAINFKEPLLVGIIIFDLLMFLLTILVRYQTFHSVLFFSQLALCLSLTYINDYFNKHWESIATQNYFDKNGLFVSVLVGLPLILNCILILCFILKSTFNLLIEAKAKKD